MEQGELPPLDVPPSTPHTRGHLPLQELGFSEGQEEEALDLTTLTFDEAILKIVQERKKYYSRNPTEPLSVTTDKEIVPNITVNPKMIALVKTTFITAMEHNVPRMRKQITNLHNRLYASEQRAASAE